MPAKLSPTALVWPYPLMRPSSRFRRFNDAARQDDLVFDDLPTIDKTRWQAGGSRWPWFWWCLLDLLAGGSSVLPLDVGKSAHRGVNLANLSNGLPYTPSCPETATVPDGDTFSIVGSTFLTVRWDRPTFPPALDYILSVSAVALNNIPERGPAGQRFRFAYTAPINRGSNVSLAPVFAAAPGLASARAISFCLSVAQAGQAPFFAQRVAFSAPYA